jgi:hypothetical protein
MLDTLISLLLPLGNAALGQGYKMMHVASSAIGRGVDRKADESLEAVCLFSLLGLMLTLAFARVAGA